MATNPTIDVALDLYDVDPAWDLDRTWSEAEYLKLDTNRLVEFVDGMIEVLPMPTLLHQLIVGCLYVRLLEFVKSPWNGPAPTAPFPVYTRKTRYREPDVLFLSKKTASEIRLGDASCDHADLVMEVVSDDDRRRDLLTKRREYARAGIPEYSDRRPATRRSRSSDWSRNPSRTRSTGFSSVAGGQRRSACRASRSM